MDTIKLIFEPRQINKICEALSFGREEGFRDWLSHISSKVLDDERQNIKNQYDGYFKLITCGADVEAYKETKGEFEKLLSSIWECVESRRYKAAENLTNAMLGMFWELQFCSLVGGEGTPSYWFQKWEPLGTPRFAWGRDIPKGGYSTPDIMLMVGDRYWVFIEVKHVLTISSPGDKGFMLRPKEYNRIQRLRKCKPSIPFWLVINNAGRLGKWAIENENQDWIVWNFDKHDKPEYNKESPYGRATWTKDEQGMYFLPRKGFALLKSELKDVSDAT